MLINFFTSINSYISCGLHLHSLLKVLNFQSPCLQFFLNPLEISFIRVSKARSPSTRWSLMVNSLPDYAIILASSDWLSNLKGQFSSKSFRKESQNFSSFNIVRKVSRPSRTAKTVSILFTRWESILYYDHILTIVMIISLKRKLHEGYSLPLHNSIGHFSHLSSINLAANCTFQKSFMICAL